MNKTRQGQEQDSTRMKQDKNKVKQVSNRTKESLYLTIMTVK